MIVLQCEESFKDQTAYVAKIKERERERERERDIEELSLIFLLEIII